MGLLSGLTDLVFGSDDSGDGGAGASRESVALQKEVMRDWEKLRQPTREELSYYIPQFGEAVQVSPEMQRLYEMGPTAYEDIAVDPRLREYQMQTLQGLKERAETTGLTPEDEAMLYQIARQQEGQARGARDALTQEFAQRTGGVSGSGMEQVLKAMANQEAAQVAAQKGMDVAALNAQQRLAALNALGTMSTGVRGQEFEQAAQVAKAKDLINQFNTQMRAGREAANVEAANRAKILNQAAQQQQQNLQTQVMQERARQPSDIVREMYANRVGALQGKTSAATGASSALQSEAARLAQERANRRSQEGGLMTTLGTLGAAALMSDRNNKTDVSRLSTDEARQILDTIVPYKYRYKDEGKYGAGPKVGIMAQDLEMSNPGSEQVIDTSEGKMINYDPGMVTALLSSIDERLKKVEGK